ncbi:MAG: hypothetical protein WBW62_03820 [Solirubrobacterales bacterium]
MPLDNRPIPHFVADASQHGIPHGRFAERLSAVFKEACSEIEDLPAGTDLPDEVVWFPERAWSGRVWIPASANGVAVLNEGEEAVNIEFFGFVSFVQHEGEDPTDFRASVDFTDVVAADNPDWAIDLGDEVIGKWLGENGREADITLIWGRSLVKDAFAATAELEGVAVDQDPLFTDRFTLIAPDALRNYGDEAYLDIYLWNSRGKQIARESLYDIEEIEPEGESAEAEIDQNSK